MSKLATAIVPVTLFQQNCTIVWDSESKACMVVDPGGEPGRIAEALNRFDLLPERIVLTHGHLDHAGGAMALQGLINEARRARGLTPAPIVGPDRRDQFLMDGIEAQAAGYGMTGLRNCKPDSYLVDGDTVTLGGLRFEVLHCPGHSPGHVVLVEREERFALVGDVLFRGSIGRTDFGYCDHDALISAIETKLLPMGDDIRFICGHGEGSSFGVERASNPYLGGRG